MSLWGHQCFKDIKRDPLMKFLNHFWSLRKTLQDSYVSFLDVCLQCRSIDFVMISSMFCESIAKTMENSLLAVTYHLLNPGSADYFSLQGCAEALDASQQVLKLQMPGGSSWNGGGTASANIPWAVGHALSLLWGCNFFVIITSKILLINKDVGRVRQHDSMKFPFVFVTARLISGKVPRQHKAETS